MVDAKVYECLKSCGMLDVKGGDIRDDEGKHRIKEYMKRNWNVSL